MPQLRSHGECPSRGCILWTRRQIQSPKKNLENGQVDGVITRPLVVQDRQVDGVITRPLVVKLFTHLDLCEKGAKFSLRRHMCRPKKCLNFSMFKLLYLCEKAQHFSICAEGRKNSHYSGTDCFNFNDAHRSLRGSGKDGFMEIHIESTVRHFSQL